MTKELNLKLVAKMIGSLLFIESLFMMSTAIISAIYNESDWFYFVFTGLGTIILGSILVFIGKNASKTIGRREGSLVVTGCWVVFSFIGMLPFWLSGSIPSFTDAYFETMSGFTTTGASILNNIEELSHGMLFWRSLTHWMGGLGIIVISLALLPMFGFSGIHLFGAESSGITKDKIHPKITVTAKRLWLIYTSLTIAEIILLNIGGMEVFDSICNSFATVATGGFSTKQASIAYWPEAHIQYTIIIFMILSGINFSLYYFTLKGEFKKVLHNEEMLWFLKTVGAFTLIITLTLIDWTQLSNLTLLEKSFREALFQVTSCATTTGFITADYMLWKPITWVLILIVMLMGASAGSTSGAIKMVRIVIVFKYCYYEFQRMIHPNAIIPITYSREVVKHDIVARVLAFTLLYLFIVAFGIVFLSATGMGFMESVGAMITCQGGVGPGLGLVGPAFSFSEIPTISKWFLTFVMLIGRLELFTVLLIFTPVFWRK